MNTQRLKSFVQDFTRLADAHHGDEAAMLANGRMLLGNLVAQDDWLPEAYARPDPARYTQYLLHCDPLVHGVPLATFVAHEPLSQK